MKLRLAPAVALLAAGSLAVAQGNPRGATSVNVGGKKVSIDYGRPALKGRSLDDLTKQLPADRMWRAGENQVTTLTTEAALNVGGKTVPPGKYSLYVHAPATGDWSLAINSDNGVALGKIYDKAPENMKNEPWPYLQDYTGKIGAKEVRRRRPLHHDPFTRPGRRDSRSRLGRPHLGRGDQGRQVASGRTGCRRGRPAGRPRSFRGSEAHARRSSSTPP